MSYTLRINTSEAADKYQHQPKPNSFGVPIPGHTLHPSHHVPPGSRGSLSCAPVLWEVCMMHPGNANGIYLGISSFRTLSLCQPCPAVWTVHGRTVSLWDHARNPSTLLLPPHPFLSPGHSGIGDCSHRVPIPQVSVTGTSSTVLCGFNSKKHQGGI